MLTIVTHFSAQRDHLDLFSLSFGGDCLLAVYRIQHGANDLRERHLTHLPLVFFKLHLCYRHKLPVCTA